MIEKTPSFNLGAGQWGMVDVIPFLVAKFLPRLLLDLDPHSVTLFSSCSYSLSIYYVLLFKFTLIIQICFLVLGVTSKAFKMSRYLLSSYYGIVLFYAGSWSRSRLKQIRST